MTKQYEVVGISSTIAGASQQVATAGAATMAWRKEGTSNRLAHSVAAFAPAPSGPGGDTDGDGLNDGAEVNTFSTNPLAPDTDGDGVSDGLEVTFGSDPLDSASAPGLRATGPTGAVLLLVVLAALGASALPRRAYLMH